MGHQGPGMAPEPQRRNESLGGRVGERAQGGVPVEEQGPGFPGAIEQLEIHPMRVRLAEHAAHEGVHPEGGVEPAQEVSAAVFQGGRRRSVPVDRHIEQESRMGARVLDQLHLARHAQVARVPGPEGSLLADGLGQHVEAQGPEVPVPEGLEVDHRAVGLPLSHGTDLVVGKALGPDLPLVPILRTRRHERGEADGLHARLQVEAGHEGGKGLPGDGRTRLEVAACGQQGALVAPQPGLDPDLGLLAVPLKGGTQRARVDGARLVPEPEGERQSRQQRQEGQPGSVGSHGSFSAGTKTASGRTTRGGLGAAQGSRWQAA